MNRLLLMILLTALVVNAPAQSECSTTIADLPEIHGLRLGMSRHEVERTFTVTSEAVVHRGPDKKGIRNVEGVWFDFFQESLSVFEFDYDRGTEWKNIGEFAVSLERSLRLPRDSWVFVDTTEAVMECEGFAVAISSVRNTLTMTDTFAKSAARN